jgi:hypothetical protein
MLGGGRKDKTFSIFLCKQNVAKSKEAKVGCTLTESSKEGCSSKGALLVRIIIFIS